MKALHSEKWQHRATRSLCALHSLCGERVKTQVQVLVGSLLPLEARKAALAWSRALSAWTLSWVPLVPPPGRCLLPPVREPCKGTPGAPHNALPWAMQLFTAVRVVLCVSCRTVHSKGQRRKSCVPRAASYHKEQQPHHVGEATESSDSHGLFLLLLDYNYNHGSRLSSCACEAPC